MPSMRNVGLVVIDPISPSATDNPASTTEEQIAIGLF
jgi:hypothetical protein